jgi:NAD-dependent deacetylase
LIAPDVKTAIARLRELVDGAACIVPFTGAGISTECGIPDFRSPAASGPRCGRSTFSDFVASQEARDESWRRRFAMEEQFGGAQPGRGHTGARSLYRIGKSPGVVTQNIDNLHQASGIAAEHVIELHGNTTYATCLDCAARYELPWVRAALSTRQRPRAVVSAVQRPHQDRDRRRSASRCPRRRCGGRRN